MQQRQRARALGEAQHAQQHGETEADRPEERVRGLADAGAGGERQGEGRQGGDTARGGPVLLPTGEHLGEHGEAEGRAQETAGEVEGEGLATQTEFSGQAMRVRCRGCLEFGDGKEKSLGTF